MYHWLGLVHCILVGSENISQMHILGMPSAWNTGRCSRSLPVPLLWPWEPTVPLVSFWQGRLWNPWAAVQLIHSSTQLHKIQVSAQFRVATSVFIYFCNCGSWLLLHFKGFVLKVMGNHWIANFLEQSELALSLCQHISEGRSFPDSSGKPHSGIWAHGRTAGAFGYSLATCALSCWGILEWAQCWQRGNEKRESLELWARILWEFLVGNLKDRLVHL